MDFGNIRYLTRRDHRDETGSSEFSSFDIETALVWQEFSQVEPAMCDAKSYELFINGKWRAGGS
ncbi:MAG: hypothetical protein E5W25_19305, partial [Mesorhizobium sp.]